MTTLLLKILTHPSSRPGLAACISILITIIIVINYHIYFFRLSEEYLNIDPGIFLISILFAIYISCAVFAFRAGNGASFKAAEATGELRTADQKNRRITFAAVPCLIFGPLGLFYSTKTGGTVMTIIFLILVFIAAGMPINTINGLIFLSVLPATNFASFVWALMIAKSNFSSETSIRGEVCINATTNFNSKIATVPPPISSGGGHLIKKIGAVILMGSTIAFIFFIEQKIRTSVFDQFCPSNLKDVSENGFTFLGDNCLTAWWHPLRFLDRVVFGCLAAWTIFQIALKTLTGRSRYLWPLALSFLALFPTLLLDHGKQAMLMQLNMCKFNIIHTIVDCPWYSFLFDHRTTFQLSMVVALIFIVGFHKKPTKMS